MKGTFLFSKNVLNLSVEEESYTTNDKGETFCSNNKLLKKQNQNIYKYNTTNNHLIITDRNKNTCFLKNCEGQYLSKTREFKYDKENAMLIRLICAENGTYLAYGRKYLGICNNDNTIYFYDRMGEHTKWNQKNDDLFHTDFRLCRLKWEIVVARYKENPSVFEPFNGITTIYNKGSKILGKCKIEVLPNVGRESHTYLHHVIKNYNSLANKTLFTQGEMSRTHNPYSIEQYLFTDQCRVINLCNRGETFCNQTWGFLKHVSHWKKEYDSGHMRKTKLTMGDWIKKVLKMQLPLKEMFQFSHGAIFSVDSSIIRSRSKQYYETIIKHVDDHVNPEEGHYMERSWNYIFKAPIRKNLVVICTNQQSLNNTDLFNVVIIDNGDKRIPCNGNCEIFEHKGTKWESIRWYLENSERWNSYQYIWFPDDQGLTINNVTAFFEQVNKNKYDLCEPASSNMPCFRTGVLRTKILPFLKENPEIKYWDSIDIWLSQHLKLEKHIVANDVKIGCKEPEKTREHLLEQTNIARKYGLTIHIN